MNVSLQPEALASLRADTARLADMARDLDTLKNRLPNEPRLRLAALVIDLHALAEALAVQHGFAIYALDDSKEAA